ncbi:MAG: hypothetical protein ABSF47_02440 [Minisyncoccia bacterium]|jgi:hypothetical protein
MNSETRNCQNCKQPFKIESEDFGFYEKMGVLPPVLCPDCRMKRRLVWRNERTLYKRTCDLCKKSIVSVHHPNYPSPVYCVKCHHSDNWDPYSFGVAYDPSRPFFDQFKELLLRIPKAATHHGTADGSPNVNSEYVNFAGGNKDCYLIFNSSVSENCSYSRGLINCRDTMDSYFADQVERCYEGVNINKSNSVIYGQDVFDSMDSMFLLNCVGVQHCFGCVNLRHKSYHFFNEPLSKDEWEKRVGEIRGSHQKTKEARRRFEVFALTMPRKENNNMKSVNCSGDYIFESKGCSSCFEIFASENCKYGFSVKLANDCYDLVGRGHKSELLLEGVGVGHGCSRVIGSWVAEVSHDVEYSYDVRSCEYCFGCAALRHARFCIFNRQYSEKEYKKIREDIVSHMKQGGSYGMYFPPALSPWAYNETLAQENFPLTKETAVTSGFRWEEGIPRTKGKETLLPEQIPDNIKDVSDSILNETLKCISCGHNYRLTPAEFALYRELLVPVPRECFDCRYLDRIRRRGPIKLYVRKCAKCGKSINTTFAPDRPEIIYCEQCYQAEVV